MIESRTVGGQTAAKGDGSGHAGEGRAEGVFALSQGGTISRQMEGNGTATASSSSARSFIGTDDFAVGRQGSVEGQADGVGARDVEVVDCLDVEVGLGAVAGVAAAGEHVTYAHLLASGDLNATLLQVAQCDDDAATVDQNMVSSERRPARCRAAALSQRIAD